MKKIILLLFTALLCVLPLAACGNCAGKAPSSASGNTAPPPSPPGVIQSQPSQPPQDPSSLPGSDSGTGEEVEHSVTGIINGAGMGRFQVELEDGRVLEFPHEGADLTQLEDTRPGSPITIYYYGTITGNDTAGITVTRMETPK